MNYDQFLFAFTLADLHLVESGEVVVDIKGRVESASFGFLEASSVSLHSAPVNHPLISLDDV